MWKIVDFKKWRKERFKKELDISIHENISGNYYYHIAINDIPLCGEKNTMRREIKLASWGFVSSHIGERYCKKCERLWIKGGI